MLLPFFHSSVLGLGSPRRWRLRDLWQPSRKAKRKGDFKRDVDYSFSLISLSSPSSSFVHLFLL